MAKYSGKDMDFYVGSTAVVNLTSVEVTEIGELIDASSVGNDYKDYLGGLQDGTATVNFIDDDTGTAAAGSFSLFTPASTVSCTFYPAGTGAGQKATFSAVVTNRQRSAGYNSPAAVAVNLQVSGGVTWTGT